LNRSLPGLTAQACSRKSVSCSSVRRAGFFFRSHPAGAHSTFLTGRRSVTCPFFVALHLFSFVAQHFCVRSLRHCLASAPVTFFFDRSFRATFCLFACQARHFSLCSHFPLRRAQFSFACRHALSGHFPGAQIFCLLPLSRTAGPVRAKKKFFWWSPVWCACRIFFCMQRLVTSPAARADFLFFFGFACRHLCAVRSTAGVRMQEFFFICAVRSTAGVCMQEFFFLSGHLFSAGRTQFFFGRSCSARAPCMRVRGANFSVQSLSAAARTFFFQPHTTAL
jgi:hypothetical protein